MLPWPRARPVENRVLDEPRRRAQRVEVRADLADGVRGAQRVAVRAALCEQLAPVGLLGRQVDTADRLALRVLGVVRR